MSRLFLTIPNAVWISFLLAGCASQKDAVLPQEGPTMEAIYKTHMAGLDARPQRKGDITALPPSGVDHYVGFVREAANEIDTLFPRLPNPTLVMYVYPHLAGEERTPVPGYITTFPFYKTVEYALPGEVPSR